jgi:hypothetical protein
MSLVSTTRTPRCPQLGKFRGGFIVALGGCDIKASLDCGVGIVGSLQVDQTLGPVKVCVWLVGLGHERLFKVSRSRFVLAPPRIFHAHGIEAKCIARFSGEEPV